MFEDFDFVAVGVGDEGHLFAVDELLAPIAWPEVGFKVEAFEHFTILDDVIDANTGVNQIFGDLDFVIRGVRQFQLVRAGRQFEVCELVAGGRLVGAAHDFKAAGLAIPVDGLL